MYENDYRAKNALIGAQQCLPPQDRSLKESLSERIRFHETEAARLRDVVKNIESKPLMDLKLSELRELFSL